MNKGRSPNAFTLVELLVVIAIIGILVSILLPAVQAAREAGRRVSCRNNIRQLALATRNYTETYQVLPASGIVDVSTLDYRGRSGKMFSWIVLILPYIEQQNLHDQFDFGVSMLEQSQDPQAVHVGALRCSSDGNSSDFYSDSTFTGGKRFAKGNYAAYCSPFHTDLQRRFPGALVAHWANGPQDIAVDGETNTWMLAEVRTYPHPRDQRGVWALPWTGASLLAFDMHEIRTPVDWGEAGYTHSVASLGATQVPNNQGPNMDMLYDCPDPAGAIVAKMPCNVYIQPADPTDPNDTSGTWLSAAPRSQHPGGVNTAFVDGSVHFVTDEIDEVTMAYLISVGDGQAITLP